MQVFIEKTTGKIAGIFKSCKTDSPKYNNKTKYDKYEGEQDKIESEIGRSVKMEVVFSAPPKEKTDLEKLLEHARDQGWI